MHDLNGMGLGMGFGMGWLWIIGLIIIGTIVWFIVKESDQSNKTIKPGKKSAFDILQERYARGEINGEEYQEKKRDLSS